jgi:hypothetical protein
MLARRILSRCKWSDRRGETAARVSFLRERAPTGITTTIGAEYLFVNQ